MIDALPDRHHSFHLGAFAAVLGLHALVLGALVLSRTGEALRVTPPQVLYVQFLAAEAAPALAPSPPPLPAPPLPAPPPPKPRVIATPAPAANATPEMAAPPAESPPAPAAEAPAAAEPAPAAAAPPPAAEPALQPPRHDLAYLSNPRPAYPPRSIELGEEGTVTLEVQVGADGTVRAVKLQRSSGYPRLDQAALRAVRRWQFAPSRRGDTPVDGIAIVPMPFTLKQD
jgi:protein TonB